MTNDFLTSEIESLRKEKNFCIGEYLLSQQKRMRCQPWKDMADKLEERITRFEKEISANAALNEQ